MIREKLAAYLYANLFKVAWSAFVILGGGVFVVYYAHIGYMPTFDLASSITIIATAAATTIMVMVLLAAIMIFPGIFWGNTWGSSSPLAAGWKDENGCRMLRYVFLWFGAPVFLSCASLVLCLTVTGYAAIILVVPIAYCLWACWKTGRLGLRESVKETSTFLFMIVMCSFIMTLSFLIVVSLAEPEGQAADGYRWIMTATVMAFVFATNIVATSNPASVKPWLWYGFLGGVAVFILFFSLDKVYRVPGAVMKWYKFGNIQVDRLVMKQDACRAFRGLDIDAPRGDTGLCVARDVLILSRLGQEAYLRIDSGGSRLEFTIPSSDIVSWSVRREKHDAAIP